MLDGKSDYGYFLEEGIASVVATVNDGNTVELGVIGIDGVVGLPILTWCGPRAGTHLHSDRRLRFPHRGRHLERRI
ncbi:MAG: hypothetical protein P4M04_05915 [Acidobacteriota bacterium]|nr:hypothetical protein [Acidobacteriota bacterium]